MSTQECQAPEAVTALSLVAPDCTAETVVFSLGVTQHVVAEAAPNLTRALQRTPRDQRTIVSVGILMARGSHRHRSYPLVVSLFGVSIRRGRIETRGLGPVELLLAPPWVVVHGTVSSTSFLPHLILGASCALLGYLGVVPDREAPALLRACLLAASGFWLAFII